MNPSTSTYRLGHRPALDGLRGLAIVLVLLNHTGIPYTGRAGTIGVTAFFVLSGFLITRLLVEEHERSGTVSLRHFYARRALRLLPAMGAYLVVTTVVALRYAQPLDQLAYAGLYVTNVARSFGADVRLTPHTWSLAMEEQFYVVWPLVLVVVLATGRSRHHLLRLAVAGIVASMALRLWLVAEGASLIRLHNDPLLAGGVLLVGCVLGLTIDRFRPGRVGATVAVVVGAVVMVATSPGEKAWDLYLVVVPLVTVATAGLVGAMAHDSLPRWVVRTATWRPLHYLGRISYGLYLWHYTVYFVVKNEVTTYPAKPLLQIGLAVLVAVLSYHMLEVPFLRMKDRFRPRAAGASPDAPYRSLDYSAAGSSSTSAHSVS